MLTGLLSSLLSGMEEPDEGIQKMVMELMNQINNSVGDKFYISTLWYILLKNSKNRIATFKIMFKKFSELDPKTPVNPVQRIIKNSEPQLQEMTEYIGRTDSKLESFYPNLWMIVNAIVKCLEDPDIGIRKNCLDFMIKHVDVRSDKLLDDSKRVQIFESVLKLLDTNDFSMLKRVFKLLFNANDVALAIDQSPQNQSTLLLLSKGFSHILNKQTQTSMSSQIPFKIIEVLNQNNPHLLKTIFVHSSYDFTNFLHRWGYEQPAEINRYIVEQTRHFVTSCNKYLEDYLSSFENVIRLKSITSHDLSLMEFIIKIIISNSDIAITSKFRLTLALMDAAFCQLDQHFERSLSNSNGLTNSLIDEGQSSKMKQFDRIMLLLPECTIILNDMLNTSGITLDEELKVRIGDLLDKDSALLEKLLMGSTPDPLIIDNYAKIFSVFMKIDALQKVNVPEFISYSALKFLFSLFDFESKYPTISSYNQIIYGQKRNYEAGGACWIIMAKIVDLVEIYDFKKLALAFLFKFFRFNLGFVSRYLLNLLKQRNAEGFKSVSLLWHATSHYTNSDCRLVLQDTVFEMLTFVEIKDPLIKNYFKNWLTQSQDNFIIILDAVLKDIIKYTNWNFNEKKEIVYKVPYDCEKFLMSLSNLSTIFNYSTTNFVHYIQTFTITPEFEFYDNEMNILLAQYFNVSEQKKYLYFIIKIFLRYLIGQLDTNISADAKEFDRHCEQVLVVKESLVQLLEKFIGALSDQKTIIQICIPLIRITSRLLEQALNSDLMVLQLAYLSFIQYLLFGSNITANEDIKGVISGIILDPQFLSTYLLGLGNQRHFVIREFIDFGSQMNFLLAKYLKHPQLTQFVQSIVISYLDNITKRYSHVKSLKEEEQLKESMTALLKGLKMCLEFFLQVDEIEEKISSGALEKTFITIFTLGIYQTKDEIRKKISFLKDENTCKHIIGLFEKIFDRLCFCWKIIGVISDEAIYERFNPKSITKIEKNKADLIGISKRILNIVKPLSVNFLDRTIEAFIQNWIQNNDAINIASSLDSLVATDNIKILEILFLLEIPPARLLSSLLNCKQLKAITQLKRYETIKSKKEMLLIRETQTYECNFLSFIFSYMKYVKNTENSNPEIYAIMLKIFKHFDYSATPATLSWIFDTLNLLLQKFPLEPSKFTSVRAEWVTFLIELLNKSLKLILKEQGLVYKDSSHDYRMAFPLAPSLHDFNQGFTSKSKQKNAIATNDREIISGNHYIVRKLY